MAWWRRTIGFLLVTLMLACTAAAQAQDSLLALASVREPLTAQDVPADLVKLISRQKSDTGEGVYTVSNTSIRLRAEAAQALTDMCLAAEQQGYVLYVRQGYRSYEDEASRYQRLTARGQQAVKPGQSDYQTGLAVTVVNKDWRNKTLTAEFGQTEEAQWLKTAGAEFGFVLRYPDGKEAATGWAWEPWHLRYVGKDTAIALRDNDLCLEEYLLGEAAYIPVEEEEPAVEETTAEESPQPTPMPQLADDQGPDGDWEISLADIIKEK